MQSVLTPAQHAVRAAKHMTSWGPYATARYLAKRRVPYRLVLIALKCELETSMKNEDVFNKERQAFIRRTRPQLPHHRRPLFREDPRSDRFGYVVLVVTLAAVVIVYLVVKATLA